MTGAQYIKIPDDDGAASSPHRESRVTDDGLDLAANSPVEGFRRARGDLKSWLLALCLLVFALIGYTFGRYSRGFEERKCADTAWGKFQGSRPDRLGRIDLQLLIGTHSGQTSFGTPFTSRP